MKLSDNMVADVCRRTGFAGDGLHVAIASAIAASNGIASYEMAIYPGPVAIYKGLWGVDLCEHDHLIGVDLSDPWMAAAVALEMTEHRGTFAWCPAFRNGRYRAFLHRARVASTMSPANEQQENPIVGNFARDSIERLRERMSDLADGIARRHQTRGT